LGGPTPIGENKRNGKKNMKETRCKTGKVGIKGVQRNSMKLQKKGQTACWGKKKTKETETKEPQYDDRKISWREKKRSKHYGQKKKGRESGKATR